MPSNGFRKWTVKAPPLGELNRGVLYAFQVLPPSPVARTLAIVAPPVAIQAFLPPCVVTQVPLDAKENSPGNAGGMLLISARLFRRLCAGLGILHSPNRCVRCPGAASRRQSRH